MGTRNRHRNAQFFNRKVATIACALVVSLWTSHSAFSKENPLATPIQSKTSSSDIEKAPPKLEIVTLEFPPLESSGPNGQAVGAAVDIVSEVFANLNIPVTIKVFPWTRSLQLVKEGKADAIFTAYRIKEREAFLDYTEEVLIDQVVSLYVKTGSPLTYSGQLVDLQNKSIGVVSTISYGSKFDMSSLKYALKIERVNEFEQNLKKLASGRVDYIISNRYTAALEIERLGFANQIVELQPPVEITPSYLAFSKKRNHVKLVSKFDAALKQLKNSGRYRSILKNHKIAAP